MSLHTAQRHQQWKCADVGECQDCLEADLEIQVGDCKPVTAQRYRLHQCSKHVDVSLQHSLKQGINAVSDAFYGPEACTKPMLYASSERHKWLGHASKSMANPVAGVVYMPACHRR